MQFSQLVKGTRAVRVIDFPVDNTRCKALPDLPELLEQRQKDGQEDLTVKVGVRVLTAAEHATVLSRARQFAKDRGVEDPKELDPLFILGVQVFTLLIACVDADSPEKDRRPFFESHDQILRELDEDRIFFLYEHYASWKDEVSPQALKLNTEQLYTQLAEMGVSESDGPFLLMRPAMRWIFMRTLARQWLNSLETKSSSSSSSEGGGTPTTPTLTDEHA